MKYMTLFPTEKDTGVLMGEEDQAHIWGLEPLLQVLDVGDRDKKGKILDFPGSSVKNLPANGFDS